ncbi:hypothetical protein [Vibrio phage nt-1]|uniref:Uncharacterized protein n=1 Tax=Vibrio phage nt-1 TaxID=115992 RepID=A0A068J6P4_9CAUD|nr:hypothetical protein [Vibrio phage nt-1]AIE13770.1 hypothetical protein [Vibrio phage nt-1]
MSDIPINYIMLLLCVLAGVAGWCLSDISK